MTFDEWWEAYEWKTYEHYDDWLREVTKEAWDVSAKDTEDRVNDEWSEFLDENF